MIRRARSWGRWVVAHCKWKFWRFMYYSGLGERFFRNKRLMLTRYKHKGLYLNDIIRLGTKANPYLYMEVKRDSQSVLKLVERCEKSEQKCIDLANQVERIAELV